MSSVVPTPWTTAVQIVDGGEDIVLGDMLRDQLVTPLFDEPLPSRRPAPSRSISRSTAKQTFSLMPYSRRVEVDEVLHVDHAVGEDLHLTCRPRRAQPR